MLTAEENNQELYGEQDIAGLLCMPQVLVELIEACLEGKSSQPIAEIALQDTALTARIVLAASKTGTAALNAFEPVSSAIQQLGVPMITGIALQAAEQIVRHVFSPRELVFQYGLWFSARVGGVVARCLAPSVNYPYIEEAQLSGLMLNLGIQVLFSRHGSVYLDHAVSPWSNQEQCAAEQAEFGTSHPDISDLLIGSWKLDSFLADAVRFLHADVGQIENSSILLRIARLAQQFCQSPQGLSPESKALAERLFGLSGSETDYLEEWARGLYPGFSDILEDSTALAEDFSRSVDRLTELIFALADQEAARARLAGSDSPEELVRIARNLYLENSPATDALFFFLDQKSRQLTGIMASGQPRLIGELKIGLDSEASLVSHALRNQTLCDSFTPVQPLTVTDHLLLRLSKSRGISCQPLRYDRHAMGVVVLGVRSRADLDAIQSLQLRMFGQVVSAAMAHMALDVQDRFGEGSSLLRRVSHEVKNPLTIIGNYAEVLNHLLAENENRELAEAIKKEVRRIDDIIGYYLNQQELPGFPEQSIDLNQLIKDTLASLNEGELKPRNIVTRLELQKDLQKIATNPVLVKQILVNLIKNAAEAVRDGGMIQIETRDSLLAGRGRQAEVVIRDNGPGIDPQLQEKLFRPVVSTKGAGHGGMGLSIVKGMVDDLGGQISCHSTTAAGTSFQLLIPCLPERPFDS